MRVCILGAGLSSLTLAKALVNQNIYVDVLFPKKSIELNQTRTLGISKSNVEYFNSSIVEINKILWKLKKIKIFSDNLKNEKIIKFESKQNYLFSIIRNHELYKIIKNSLKNDKYFKEIHSLRNNFSDYYNLVINTDSNNSLSKKFFNKKIIKKYNSVAYTTIINHKKIPNNTAYQIFTTNGPLAFLPISETETSIVYSVHNSNNEQKKDINDLIEKYNFKYQIQKTKKIEKFELKSLFLRSYYHQNILAFGDLLHKVHPLAGQGFNMTIRDIIILIDIIKNKISLGLPLDKSVNQEFERKLKHKNLIFSNGIDFVHEFFNLERKIHSNFLSKSLQILGKNPSINKFFTKVADEGITI